ILSVHDQSTKLLIDIQPSKEDQCYTTMKEERLFSLKVHYVLGVFNTHLALKTYIVGHFVTLDEGGEAFFSQKILFVHDQSTKLLIDIQPSKADQSYTTMKEERLFSLKVHYVLGVFNTHLALKTYMEERFLTLKVHYVLGVFNTYLASKTYTVGHFVTL
ncbi:hypothetical protein RYX36_009149, partial [Vicia faba]